MIDQNRDCREAADQVQVVGDASTMDAPSIPPADLWSGVTWCDRPVSRERSGAGSSLVITAGHAVGEEAIKMLRSRDGATAVAQEETGAWSGCRTRARGARGNRTPIDQAQRAFDEDRVVLDADVARGVRLDGLVGPRVRLTMTLLRMTPRR